MWWNRRKISMTLQVRRVRQEQRSYAISRERREDFQESTNPGEVQRHQREKYEVIHNSNSGSLTGFGRRFCNYGFVFTLTDTGD
jgi:hypothetical protein